MRTDTIFYELFRTFPSLLFELIGQEPALAKAYQFSSVEVKELAKTMDGLFLPTDETSPIYFLEVQFQKDTDFYWRFMTEVFVYLGQYKPDRNWQAVVVWAKRSLDPGVPIPYQTLLGSNQIKQIYLDELEETGFGSVPLDIVKLVKEARKDAKAQRDRM
ncbi:MAG: Rpn family recombination-promoting nuclease/putative transposase [Prochloron sp. SP5CPC1]|nr:Rpn family recombination-promoting nuclease/putative transposase [Candidatus Paraprochloron terpiosi SP5CPC1]